MARQRKLLPGRKAFINNLIQHYNSQDVQDMVNDLLGDTLQSMLETKMEQKPEYSKYGYPNKDTNDSHHGSSMKTVTSSFDEINLDISPDRKGEFGPQVSRKINRYFQH